VSRRDTSQFASYQRHCDVSLLDTGCAQPLLLTKCWFSLLAKENSIRVDEI